MAARDSVDLGRELEQSLSDVGSPKWFEPMQIGRRARQLGTRVIRYPLGSSDQGDGALGCQA